MAIPVSIWDGSISMKHLNLYCSKNRFWVSIASTCGAEDGGEATPGSASGILAPTLLPTMLLLFPSGAMCEAEVGMLGRRGTPNDSKNRKHMWCRGRGRGDTRVGIRHSRSCPAANHAAPDCEAPPMTARITSTCGTEDGGQGDARVGIRHSWSHPAPSSKQHDVCSGMLGQLQRCKKITPMGGRPDRIKQDWRGKDNMYL